MIISTQKTNTKTYAFVAILVSKLLSRKVLFINRKDKHKIVGMQNIQDTFETTNRSFINAFSTCMTVPLIVLIL